MSAEGKVVVVTGGARNMGFHAAAGLVRRGAKVAIVARGREAVEEAARSLGGDVLTIAAEVTDPAQIAEALRQTADRFGGIDGIVNNAGSPIPTQSRSSTKRKCANRRRSTSSPRSSPRGRRSPICGSAAGGGSSISRPPPRGHRVRSGTFRSMARPRRGWSISPSNCATKCRRTISPSPASFRATPAPVSAADGQIAQMESLPEPGRSYVIALIRQLDTQTRLRRPATMLEAGNLFAFLASDQASYITGQSIRLDGGFSL